MSEWQKLPHGAGIQWRTRIGPIRVEVWQEMVDDFTEWRTMFYWMSPGKSARHWFAVSSKGSDVVVMQRASEVANGLLALRGQP